MVDYRCDTLKSLSGFIGFDAAPTFMITTYYFDFSFFNSRYFAGTALSLTLLKLLKLQSNVEYTWPFFIYKYIISNLQMWIKLCTQQINLKSWNRFLYDSKSWEKVVNELLIYLLEVTIALNDFFKCCHVSDCCAVRQADKLNNTPWHVVIVCRHTWII